MIVDLKCLTAITQSKTTKKTKQPQKLIFLEHMRIGTVEVIISTRGITPLNLNRFDITLQHQLYSNLLTTWQSVIRQIRLTYTTEVLKSAPSYVLRKWNFGQKTQNEFQQRMRSESGEFGGEGGEEDEVTRKRKISLLLGDYHTREE